jgi:hypothetical protein
MRVFKKDLSGSGGAPVDPVWESLCSSREVRPRVELESEREDEARLEVGRKGTAEQDEGGCDEPVRDGRFACSLDQ